MSDPERPPIGASVRRIAPSWHDHPRAGMYSGQVYTVSGHDPYSSSNFMLEGLMSASGRPSLWSMPRCFEVVSLPEAKENPWWEV